MQEVTTIDPKARQRQEALARANEVRSARAKYKKDLRNRVIPVDELLFNPPGFVLDATLFEVLTWLPGIGKTKALKILRDSAISTTLTLRHLAEKRRHTVLAHIRYRQTDRDQQLQAA